MNLQVKLEPLKNLDAIASNWQNIELESVPSYFQSWGWLKCWLEMVGNELDIYLIQFLDNKKIVGMGILSSEFIKRRVVFTSQTLVLNSTKLSRYNMISEHNQFLVISGYEQLVWSAFSKWFSSQNDYEEFFVQFGDLDLQVKSIWQDALLRHELIEETPSYFVDLQKLRQNNETYLSSISSNTRSKIRSSIKKYQQFGEIELQIASNVEEALETFYGLKDLHQQYWISRGKSGSFANRAWENFHCSLIKDRFEFGEIQLAKVTVLENVIGYVYSLVKDGNVYMIQSGFNYELDTKAKPGYVCHNMVIDWNLENGNLKYDFLVGDSQYKRSLSSDSETQYTYVIQKRKLKFLLEMKAVGLLRMFRS